MDRRPEPGGHYTEPEGAFSRDREARDPGRAGNVGNGDGGVLAAAPASIRRSIQTEVLLLPAAFFMEKNGTITNSGGWCSGGYAGVKPPGQARPDGADCGLGVPARARPGARFERSQGRADPESVLDATRTPEDVLREINGRVLRDVPDTELKAGDAVRQDRRPAAGRIHFSGVLDLLPAFSADGENLSKRRDSRTDPGGLGLYPNFGWTWPNNMRILYNRASCDRHGKPYPGSKPLVWWDARGEKWTGHDVPDVPGHDGRS